MWRQCLYRDHQEKIRSLGWSLTPNYMGPYKKGIFGHRDTHEEEEHHMTMEAEIKKMLLQAKEHQGLPGNHQKLGEGHGTDSLSEPSKRTPWSQTSSLQNCGTNHCMIVCMKFLLSKPLSLWYLVLVAQQTDRSSPSTVISQEAESYGTQS